MHFFFQTLLYSWSKIRHTEYIVMITKKGYTKIVNFMTPTPMAGILVLGCGHISHIMKMQYFFKISFLLLCIDQTN